MIVTIASKYMIPELAFVFSLFLGNAIDSVLTLSREHKKGVKYHYAVVCATRELLYEPEY